MLSWQTGIFRGLGTNDVNTHSHARESARNPHARNHALIRGRFWWVNSGAITFFNRKMMAKERGRWAVFQQPKLIPFSNSWLVYGGSCFWGSFSDKGFTLACGEQTLFSALVSPAEKIAIFWAGKTRAEKIVCSQQASEHTFYTYLLYWTSSP